MLTIEMVQESPETYLVSVTGRPALFGAVLRSRGLWSWGMYPERGGDRLESAGTEIALDRAIDDCANALLRALAATN